jgi:hypothetical protein
MDKTSPTHVESHVELQQCASTAQMELTHESQLALSFAPAAHGSCAQLDPNAPAQVLPQMLPTSPTQMESHALLQQYESAAQTSFTHASQFDLRFVPFWQGSCAQFPPYVDWQHVGSIAQTWVAHDEHVDDKPSPGTHMLCVQLPLAGLLQYSLNWQSAAVEHGCVRPFFTRPGGNVDRSPLTQLNMLPEASGVTPASGVSLKFWHVGSHGLFVQVPASERLRPLGAPSAGQPGGGGLLDTVPSPQSPQLPLSHFWTPSKHDKTPLWTPSVIWQLWVSPSTQGIEPVLVVLVVLALDSACAPPVPSVWADGSSFADPHARGVMKMLATKPTRYALGSHFRTVLLRLFEATAIRITSRPRPADGAKFD